MLLRTFTGVALGVFHVALGSELDLSSDDLGHPTRPTLWDDLYRRVKRGVLQCLQRRVERPDCPEWMCFRIRRGQQEGVTSTPRSPATGRVTLTKRSRSVKRTPSRGGSLEANIEQRVSHGRRRTDVLVGGNGVTLGCEPQLSRITAQAVRRRSATARADGITPMWMTDDRKAQLIDQAPRVRIDRMPWHLT